ncbi:polysaccharide biosynthesis protein [Parabacteroides sp. BX2]|jgi:FlaA1/EpsC-like NDP-sugar epimerase|uniref:Polysaccharide biosynthesis protein n=1 Tax=Parabacteroides segnis TaxID=2763058 RepID=A0ABR7DYY1_9BACT|nr:MULTISPECIES: nucleoside-diphosphate sugar epimerase/dehydratase [Parabacteroides]MBC5642638.1 polysaccharide biosynthesis protein [Parabacteroides segnis]MCM0711610.1 polysaccharide biosynthesis protein [Parabacteroides sp. TA-V-105]
MEMNNHYVGLQRLFSRFTKMRYINGWIIFSFDLIISLSVSLIGVLGLLSFLGVSYTQEDILKGGFASLVGSLIAFFTFKVYHGVIRHSTLRGLWRIWGVAILKSVVLCILLMVLKASFTPKVYLVGLFIDCVLTMLMLVTFRIFIINIYNMALLQLGKKRKQVLVYGTGDESVMIASTATRHIFMQDYSITGFLTFNKQKRNFRIAELPVYQIASREDLLRLVNRNSLDGILFPNLKTIQQEKDRLIRFCEQISLHTLVVPEMEEVHNGAIKRSIRDIKIEDLLGREEIQINMQEIACLLENKVILVTGAAGSIGSEICRQLAHFPICKLICFDSAETPMHNLRLELEDKFPNLNFVPVIGDVRNGDRLDYVFRTWHPHIVFHAAAYKHVPLMEENPCEAVRVNVYGTRLVADAAVKYGVEKFVMISTDKAVNPTNIMGCSKRLAEIYVQSLSLAIIKGEVQGSTKFITTRFGNVLGSNGSVIPRFREQINNGGPVTVTHPEIIRYFMTIPEACRLVLEAGTMGNGGEIFVFDMGQPVKIADLAQRMIELSGMKVGKDIEIEYTGLRPGEKLYEELLSHKENTKETLHEKIRIADVREYNYQDVEGCIEILSKLSLNVEIVDMVRKMKSFVPEFKSQNSEFEKLDL